MVLSAVTNIAAINAYRNVSRSSDAMNRSLERLSSGYRINRASDDAAGLAISEGLRSQVGGLAQAVRNTQDGVSVVQTAEGALGETTSILQRMRDLAVQAANVGGLDHDARADVQHEMDQLTSELTRIAGTTTFNGTPLLDGTYRGVFQVGANVGETIPVPIGGAMDATGLGVDSLNVFADTDPAEVDDFPAHGRRDLLRTGVVVFPGVSARPGGIPPLTGTLTYGGHTLDLDEVSYTDVDGNPVTDNAGRVAALNAAAAAAGMTHRADPFIDDGNDLLFRGVEPTADTTDDQLTDLSPDYDGDSGGKTFRAVTSIPPQGGMLAFPGTLATALPALKGSISANGHTLDLRSVRYTDDDGDGIISGSEALARLNAAARAAGITSSGSAFSQGSIVMLSEDQYVDLGVGLEFFGDTPAADATPAEVARATPVFTPGLDPITLIDRALRTVSDQRADLGALQNRFEHTIANLGVASESTAASLSRIRDADMAREMTGLSRNQVLLQTGTAMLSQATQVTQTIVKLLQS